jgi:hypothetical protein
MKKKILTLMLVVCFIFTASVGLKATSDNDYRVLKKALKGGGSKVTKEATWLRISVTEGEKQKIMIKVPVSLIELFSDCLDEEVTVRDGKKVDLKEVLALLVANGPQTIVEITDEDQVVKIWVE